MFNRVKSFGKIMNTFTKAKKELEVYSKQNATLRDLARTEAKVLEARATAHQLAVTQADKVMKNLNQFLGE